MFQDAPTNYMSNISYFVLFAESSTLLNFTMTTCNSTNYCTLRVLGSELSPSDTHAVSVVASNIVGSGTAAVFPNTGYYLCEYRFLCVCTLQSLFNIQRTLLNYTFLTTDSECTADIISG